VDREPKAPPAAARITADDELMLCLGVDYRHKNRLFALELVRRLQSESGWTGLLVLAGPSMANGSSRPQEQRLLAAHPGLAGSVLDCGPVTDSERDWLYGRARLVVYPTVYEGFGLIPFEAAAHGVPCLWAPVTSLGELLPADAARIVPWDASATVPAALELLRDEAARTRNLETIRSAGAGLRWDATAAELVTAYQAACDAPPSRSGERELSALGEDALRLVGPGGALPAELHRPLLALAMRPRIVGPLSWAAKLGYRTAHRIRLSRPRGR
jgi:glycosyltransferase involved in cell wall biosynthesis